MCPQRCPHETEIFVDLSGHGEVAIAAVSALVDRIGPGVVVTHSYSGGLGWQAGMQNPAVRAVVSFEPGSGFVLPEGEVPATMSSLTGPLAGVPVTMTQFNALTRIPIVESAGPTTNASGA